MQDVVGPGVSAPVTVFDAVDRKPGGELAHEGNRVPDLAVLDENHLVVGWRAGVGDAVDPTPGDQGSIRFARSADGGRTWTQGVLAQADATHRYHYVIFLNDAGTLYAFLGRIAIARDRDPSGNVDGFPVEMIAKRSADGGRTWTPFPLTVEVPANARGVVVAGKPVKQGGVWLLPYWQQTARGSRTGVLRSTDLSTWRPGGFPEPPPGIAVEEPQVVVAQDDPGSLLMVVRTLVSGTPEAKDAYYRTHAAYAATAVSGDGGLTWTPLRLDHELPNFYVKGFFAKDSAGRYLTIYNTLAGPFMGERPDQYREVLHYKVRRPGETWGPGRLFADGPRLTTGAARGWDVYASAEEYAPGRFFVVWEHNQTVIKVARLDITRAFTGVTAASAAGWVLTGEARADDGIRLPGSASQRQAPSSGFIATFSGSGFSLKVATGVRRLMLDVRADGVFSGERRLASAGPRVWRVLADRRGNAMLYGDAADTGARWVLPDNADTPQVSVWSSAAAHVSRLEVTDNLAGCSWAGWALEGGARLTGGAVQLRGRASASIPLDAAEGCDFTVEFRAEALSGELGVKVANGAKRLMLAVQPREVRALRKGSAQWERVHTHQGGVAVWQVRVDSAGVARLYRDGADTGATWVIQDSRERPQATHWLTGTASARVEWTLVTSSLSEPRSPLP